jgi:hypothetical protein
MYARDWRGPSRIPFAARTRIAMSFTYRIDPEAGVLYVTAEGHVSQEERLKTMAAWLSDPLFRPGLHTYCDFSASASTPTLAELRAIVEYIERNAKRIGRVKLAVLAPKMVTFGVARQFQAMSAGGSIEVRVFTESRAAWNWLQGKPEPEPLV